MESNDIQLLIVNYLAGNVTNEEAVFFEAWINASPANRKYFLQVKNIWEASDRKFDPAKISTQAALKKVLNRISKISTARYIWQYWQKMAAVLIIPLILSALFFKHLNSSEPINYNEVYTTFGTRTLLTLSDGSVVWLNSGSRIKYPDKFANKERKVSLEGEAYFEVQSDPTKPFIVHTSTIDVKATGTKFNVQAYKSSPNVKVSLVAGKVTVYQSNKPEKPISELKPDYQFTFDTLTGENKLKQDDMYKFTSWIDGKLVFRNDPLTEVIERLNQLYNVDIEITENELKEYHYRATFENESLDEILKILKASAPIDYKQDVRKPSADGSLGKQKIRIFPIKNK